MLRAWLSGTAEAVTATAAIRVQIMAVTFILKETVVAVKSWNGVFVCEVCRERLDDVQRQELRREDVKYLCFSERGVRENLVDWLGQLAQVSLRR